MQSSESMERCDNCSQLFPQSKINSHFSYCRRNIKKCSQCSRMVDINVKQEHDQEFHTNKVCQHCKKEFKGQELVKHQGGCKLKPKYCEFCQLNISVSQFDRHIISCGSRTNTCLRCEKHIMLKDFNIHQVQCKGKVVEPPPPPAKIIEAFKKKQSREEREQYNRYIDPKIKQQVQVPTTSNNAPKIPSSKQIKQDVRRIEHTSNIRQNPPTLPTNQRKINENNDRNIGGISSKSNAPTVNVQSSRNAYKKQEARLYPQYVPKIEQQHKPTYQAKKQNKRERQESQQEKLQRQQKQYLKRVEKQRLQKKIQEPKSLPSYVSSSFNHKNFDLAGEQDVQLQRMLMQSLENKVPRYKSPTGFADLGIDIMSQSMYRDIQAQSQIEASLKQRPAPRRA